MWCLGAESRFRSFTVAELAMDSVSEEPLSHSKLCRGNGIPYSVLGHGLGFFRCLSRPKPVVCFKVLEEVLRSTLVSQRSCRSFAVGDPVIH